MPARRCRHGQTAGGVPIITLSVLTDGNWAGFVQLNGTIRQFEIGGQELHLDDVCFLHD